jgi:hypothetical protein
VSHADEKDRVRHKLVGFVLISASLAGCASTRLTSYVPNDGQVVDYDQGVGAVTARTADATITMYPTFRYQSPGDIPTFTLMVTNTSSHDIDFNPESMTAGVDNRQCHIYTLQERVSEIHKAAVRKQVALAILGGIAAAGAGYAASHQTVSYNNVAFAGHRTFYSSGVIRAYDPAAGIFAGAAVGAATGVGMHQIAKAAGYEEQAAQGIFQRSTIHPGQTVAGQVLLKTGSDNFNAINLDVSVDGASPEVTFLRKDTL